MENGIKREIEALGYALNGLTNEIEQLYSKRDNLTSDESIRLSYLINQRDYTKNTLKGKTSRDKESSNSSDADQSKTQDEFNRKNNSYSIIRSSYPKSVDN